MIDMRNFFYGAASTSILALSGCQIYRLYHDTVRTSLPSSEKCEQMNSFYLAELEQMYENFLKERDHFVEPDLRVVAQKAFDEKVTIIEGKMLHDGYSNTDIGTIKRHAMKNVASKWKKKHPQYKRLCTNVAVEFHKKVSERADKKGMKLAEYVLDAVKKQIESDEQDDNFKIALAPSKNPKNTQ
jgi:SpoVK/Ycf46/Vps4 family AAA+-type ATPase